MNVLVVCQYYDPEPFPVAGICERLAADGHRVLVLTGLPNYPSGVIPEDYRHGRRRDETIRGVRVLRCHEFGRGHGAIRLALNYLSFCLSAAGKARSLDFDADLVFVYQLSPVFMAYPAVVYKKRRRVPLLLYSLDLWPESVKTVGISERSPVFRLTDRASRALYRACDRIAVPADSFLPYFTEVHGIPKDRLSVLPQFADDGYLTQDFTSADNGVTDFVFLGNVGYAQGIDGILDATARLSDRAGFLVHIVGDGSYLETAKRLAVEKGVSERVRFYGRRPVSEMPDFYRLADACLLTLKADTRVGLTVPAKLQGYMAAGKPVLGAISGPAKAVIEQANCGLCAEGGDAEGLAKAMRAFMDDPKRFAFAGENGRAYFKAHFTRERYRNALSAIMKEMTED